MTAVEWAQIVSAASTPLVAVALLAGARANSRLSASLRMNTLQQMVVEMDALRRVRADDPDLERSLFTGRADWDDLQIKRYVMAVQLANVFEWAYLARRDQLLDKDVWESWWETWVGVIVAAPPIRSALAGTVWTFGRSPEMAADLNRLLDAVVGDPIPDPVRHRNPLKRLLLREWLT